MIRVWQRWCSRDLVLLFVVYALLVAAAVFVLYFRQQLVGSKWMDIVRGSFDRYAETFSTGMLVTGCVLLALVLFGSIVTPFRHKKLLVVYAMWLTLSLIMMVFLIVSAFQMGNEAATWRRHRFSDDVVSGNSTHQTKQELVAQHFNSLYCDAQRAYVCDHATVNELLEFRLGNLTLSSAANSFNASESGASCKFRDSAFEQLCAYCSGLRDDYDALKSIAKWSMKKCGFSSSTAAFCSAFNATSTSNNNVSETALLDTQDVGTESPYGSCRVKLLDATIFWSEAFGIAWSATGFLLIVLLFFVVLLLRKHTHADALDLDDVDNNTEAVYEKA
uniref:Tetraspanin n=1 Tax=Globisporangium ultimum (strain ATCC 200006 / CBS 805.95 / DAOM BR144) TaxID=431595 RepID=K3WRQ6_GLOUD